MNQSSCALALQRSQIKKRQSIALFGSLQPVTDRIRPFWMKHGGRCYAEPSAHIWKKHKINLQISKAACPPGWFGWGWRHAHLHGPLLEMELGCAVRVCRFLSLKLFPQAGKSPRQGTDLRLLHDLMRQQNIISCLHFCMTWNQSDSRGEQFSSHDASTCTWPSRAPHA